MTIDYLTKYSSSLWRYEEHVLDETKPFPGMIETLEYLYRKGLKLAVLSNKPDRLSKIIESLFASVDFVAIWEIIKTEPVSPIQALHSNSVALQKQIPNKSF